MNHVKRSSSFRTFPYDYFIISTFNRHNSQFVRLVCAKILKGEMRIPLTGSRLINWMPDKRFKTLTQSSVTPFQPTWLDMGLSVFQQAMIILPILPTSYLTSREWKILQSCSFQVRNISSPKRDKLYLKKERRCETWQKNSIKAAVIKIRRNYTDKPLLVGTTAKEIKEIKIRALNQSN